MNGVAVRHVSGWIGRAGKAVDRSSWGCQLPAEWSWGRQVFGSALLCHKSLQHRLRRTTVLTTYASRMDGRTPFMQALRTAQLDAAAAEWTSTIPHQAL